MKNFRAPRLPLYKIGVPLYQNHCIIMMGTMFCFCLEGRKKSLSNLNGNIFRKCLMVSFITQSICFTENLFTFSRERRETGVRIFPSLTKNQSVFIWMTMKNNFLLKPSNSSRKMLKRFNSENINIYYLDIKCCEAEISMGWRGSLCSSNNLSL